MSFRITSSKGFHITFKNGWTASVQWGPGNYCDNYDAPIMSEPPPGGWVSGCAEIAAWDPQGNMIDLGGDTVRPQVYPAEVLAFLNEIAAKETKK